MGEVGISDIGEGGMETGQKGHCQDVSYVLVFRWS
jgi:hypothetical protein